MYSTTDPLDWIRTYLGRSIASLRVHAATQSWCPWFFCCGKSQQQQEQQPTAQPSPAQPSDVHMRRYKGALWVSCSMHDRSLRHGQQFYPESILCLFVREYNLHKHASFAARFLQTELARDFSALGVGCELNTSLAQQPLPLRVKFLFFGEVLRPRRAPFKHGALVQGLPTYLPTSFTRASMRWTPCASKINSQAATAV